MEVAAFKIKSAIGPSLPRLSGSRLDSHPPVIAFSILNPKTTKNGQKRNQRKNFEIILNNDMP